MACPMEGRAMDIAYAVSVESGTPLEIEPLNLEEQGFPEMGGEARGGRKVVIEVGTKEPVLRVDPRSPVLGGGTPRGLLGIVSVLRGPCELEGAIVDRGGEGRGEESRGDGRKLGLKSEEACPGVRGELGRYGASGDLTSRGISWLD